MHRRHAIILLTTLLVGCASAQGAAHPTSPSVSTLPTTTTAVTASKGWIGGEPVWSGADASVGRAPEMSTSAMSDSAGEVLPEADVATAADNSPLRAGSVDDNADFAAFVDYLARIHGLGVDTRPFDPTGRIVVTVTGASGLPVQGAEVTVTAAGADVATIRTTADGTARFLPMLYGAQVADAYEFSAGSSAASAAPGGTAALTVETATSPTASSRPPSTSPTMSMRSGRPSAM